MKSTQQLDEAGQQEWDRLQDKIPSTVAARSQLAILCQAWSVYWRASKELDEEGLTVPLQTGGSKPNPIISAWTQAAGIYHKTAKALKLDVEKLENERDEIDEMMGE